MHSPDQDKPTDIGHLCPDTSKSMLPGEFDLVREIDVKKKLVYVSRMSIDSLNRSDTKPCMQGSWNRNNIGLMTAGGDAQGSNAVIRSVVRMSLYLGAKTFYIQKGFRGLVEGGNMFQEATWLNSSRLTEKGGTVIKSCPCPEFQEREGRLKAAHNLVKANISCLIVIGGARSLKAMVSFYTVWLDLLRVLNHIGRITLEENIECRTLSVVNILSSVSTEIIGTEYNLGFNSAIERICEVTDIIVSTSSCSSQAYVLEVLNEELALAVGVAFAASVVYCPTSPPNPDWRKQLYTKIKADIANNRHQIMIVVTEDMRDSSGEPIRSLDVVEYLKSHLHLDARVTVLGDIQTGGRPSVKDRKFATRLGAAAVHFLAQNKSPPTTLCVHGRSLKCEPSRSLVEVNEKYRHLLEHREFSEALELKSRHFHALLDCYRDMQNRKPAVMLTIPGMADKCKRLGVVFVGDTILGLQSLIKWIVKANASHGFVTYAFCEGFESLCEDKFIYLNWKNAGALCGDLIIAPSHLTIKDIGLERIGEAIERNVLSGLIIIGDSEAVTNLNDLWEGNSEHRGLQVPMTSIPVCCYNSVPGTETSLGSDNALNQIIQLLDNLKETSKGKQKTVFIVETPGGGSDYLTRICGLCCGADAVYTKGSPPSLETLLEDAQHLRKKIISSKTDYGIVLRSKNAGENYTTKFIQKVFSEEGKGVFQCEEYSVSDVKLYIKQTNPSNQFRILSKMVGQFASDWISLHVSKFTKRDGTVSSVEPVSKSVMCLKNTVIEFKPVAKVVEEQVVSQGHPPNNLTHLDILLKICEGNYTQDYVVEVESKHKHWTETESEVFGRYTY